MKSPFFESPMAIEKAMKILVYVVSTISLFSLGSFAQSNSCSRDVTQSVIASRWHNTTITSLHYPANYSNNLTCTWLIEVANDIPSVGFILKVTFNSFQLEEAKTAFLICNDKLEFYDGNSTSSSDLLGSYCGAVSPKVVYSTGRLLYVKFRSDGRYSDKGFSLNISAVMEEEAAGICRRTDSLDKVLELGGSSGTFFTPDYPALYPMGAQCTWVISVPAGRRVKLTFEDFNLGVKIKPDAICQEMDLTDYVRIRDGRLKDSKELAMFCALNKPIWENIYDVYSTGNYMRVSFAAFKFDQLGRAVSKGFKARYLSLDASPDAYSKELCYRGNVNNNNLRLTGSNGTLKSPEKNSVYPPAMRCDWLIAVPDGKIVKLSFDRFELEPSFGQPCTEDYVEILDGKESNSANKGRFCGEEKPKDIESSGPYMRVIFRSDASASNYKGFKATFLATSTGSSTAKVIACTVGSIVLAALMIF